MSELEKGEELAQFMMDTLKDSKDFVMEQAPDVIQQFIAWKTCQHGMLVVLFVVLSLVLVCVMRWAWRYAGKEMNEVDRPLFRFLAVGCAGGGGSVGFVVGTILNLFWFVEVLVAPKVYLLEWAASVLK